MTKRFKALFIVAHSPSPDAPQAGHKTAFHFLSELSVTHDVEVVLLCKSEDLRAGDVPLARLKQLASSIVVVPISPLARASGWLLGLSRGLAPRFCTRLSPAAMRHMRQLLATTSYDLVWAEFSQSAWVLTLLGPTLRVTLSLHDVQTHLVLAKSAFERLLTMGFTAQSERALLERANRIRVQSINDKWLLRSLFRIPGEKIEVVEPALSTFLSKVRRSSSVIEPHSLLFWGAMARRENSDAALGFLRDHFPILKQKYPDAKIYVVGSNPPKELLAMAGDAVVVTGFVEDPTPYFERAGLGIAPLSQGAGIKVKVLEMLRAGLPVISSVIGAEGIPIDAGLTVSSIDAFSQVIDKIWAAKGSTSASITESRNGGAV